MRIRLEVPRGVCSGLVGGGCLSRERSGVTASSKYVK